MPSQLTLRSSLFIITSFRTNVGTQKIRVARYCARGRLVSDHCSNYHGQSTSWTYTPLHFLNISPHTSNGGKDPLLSHISRYTPDFVGFKQLCPDVTQNSVPDTKMSLVFPNHNNRTLLTTRQEIVTFELWEGNNYSTGAAIELSLTDQQVNWWCDYYYYYYYYFVLSVCNNFVSSVHCMIA